jgi:predicted DNA-binding WGR domain protein
MTEQHFQFSEGTSNKFWKIRLDGKSFTVHFGKIGTAGQVQTKDFANDAEAQKEYDKLIAEKVKKGYVAMTDSATVPAPVASKAPSTSSAGPSGGSQSSSVVSSVQSAPTNVHSASQPAADIDHALAISSAATATLDPPPIAAAATSQAKSQSPETDLDSERLIRFTNEDWKIAQWGPPENAIVKPQTKPFDLEQCIAKLLTQNKGPEYWRADWCDEFRMAGQYRDPSTPKPDVNPLEWSLEESHFWLLACSSALNMAYQKIDQYRRVAAFEGDDPAKLTSMLRNLHFRSDLSRAEVEQIVTSTRGRSEHFSWLPFPLSRLLSPIDYLEFWQSKLSKISTDMCWGFRNFIISYLSESEIGEIKAYVRDCLSNTTWNCSGTDPLPICYQAAALLCMKDDILGILQQFPNKAFANNFGNQSDAMQLIFGLRDPDLMIKEVNRIGLKLQNPRDAYVWIAATKYNGVEVLYDSIANCTGYTGYHHRAALVEILKKVVSPESARYLFNLNAQDKNEHKNWLLQHRLAAMWGLADAAQQKTKEADAARRFLRELVFTSNREEIPEALVGRLKAIDCVIPGEETSVSTSSEPPAWLVDALNTVQNQKQFKMPTWLVAGSTESIIIEGWKLTEEQLEKLISSFQQCTPEKLHPLVETLRDKCERRQFDRFVWDVFMRWVDAGGPPKEKWAMNSLGLLGSDKLIPQLLPMMYDWRENGHSQRAQAALDSIRLNGSDYALMRIHEISQSPRLKSLRARALECMDEIALSRHMTKPQLEDRIVPTCGLDADGTRVFDFGPRKFTFAFGPDLKPMVKDEKGTFKSDLPAPNQKDDTELAKQSVEDWKELKKQLKTIAKIQARRLEQSMVTCRSWTAEEFRDLLLNHPLITNLIRWVVWAAYDQDGNLIKTFRVVEDKTFSDENDRTTDIDGAARIAVIHPLNMTQEHKSKWGEIFTDYEIVPLFPQIGRPIYQLNADEENETNIKRFANISIPSAALPGTLERLGWWRGPAEDGGCYSWHYKHFYDDNISVVVEYDGIPMQMMQQWDPQTLKKCFFLPTIFKGYWGATQPMPLKRVPPIVISEALYDLYVLTSRGTEEEDE